MGTGDVAQLLFVQPRRVSFTHEFRGRVPIENTEPIFFWYP